MFPQHFDKGEGRKGRTLDASHEVHAEGEGGGCGGEVTLLPCMCIHTGLQRLSLNWHELELGDKTPNSSESYKTD